MACFGRMFYVGRSNYRNLLSVRTVVLNSQSNLVLKSRVLEQLGIPPKPKRPLSPFFKYMQEERPKILAENPSVNHQDAIRMIASRWKTCSTEKKYMLQKEYDLELINYSKKIMIYDQSISTEHRNLILEEKKRLDDRAQKLKLKKRFEMLGKPKKPPSAFIQFLQDQSMKKDKSTKVVEWVSSVASTWKSMSNDEKAKYHQEAQTLMSQYKDDIKDWEEKMVRLGNIDVVRNRGLIDIKENTVPVSK